MLDLPKGPFYKHTYTPNSKSGQEKRDFTIRVPILFEKMSQLAEYPSTLS